MEAKNFEVVADDSDSEAEKESQSSGGKHTAYAFANNLCTMP